MGFLAEYQREPIVQRHLSSSSHLTISGSRGGSLEAGLGSVMSESQMLLLAEIAEWSESERQLRRIQVGESCLNKKGSRKPRERQSLYRYSQP